MRETRGFQSFRAIGAAATALHARGHCYKVFFFFFSRLFMYLYGHLSGRYFDANSAIKYGALARARDAQRS